MYGDFAKAYARLSSVPYIRWFKYIENAIETYRPEGVKLVLDLACGMGRLTELISKKGYDCIGIDNSAELLSLTPKKSNVLYLNQDIRCFELYGTVDLITCTCDSINYILSEDEVATIFSLVRNYLNPNGLFIFDINTTCHYESVDGQTYALHDERSAVIWENSYEPESKLLTIDIDVFNKTDKTKENYQRSFETHIQRAYTFEEITHLLNESSLTVLAVNDDYNHKKGIIPLSKRITFICKK